MGTVSSYQIASWVEFAAFAVVGTVGTIILRYNAQHQITRLKVMLYFLILAASVAAYGYEALPGLGGTNVVAGRTVPWLRYALNAFRLPLFAGIVALSLDVTSPKAGLAGLLSLCAALPLAFATESSNQGVWYFFIYAALFVVLLSTFIFFFLQLPPDPDVQARVSNFKHWMAKSLAALGFLTYVFAGYLIDTPWLRPTGDLALLQWLNVGGDILFFLVFGLWVLGWVDLYESANMFGVSVGSSGDIAFPFLSQVNPVNCNNNVNFAGNGGAAPPQKYSPLPQASYAGMSLPP